MKQVISFIILSFSFHSFGQFVVGQPEYLVLFQGYDNKLEAASQNGIKKVVLSSNDFEFVKTRKKGWKNRQIYSCTACVISSATRSVIYMLNKENGDTIDHFDVVIKTLPDPSLFFGTSEPGSEASNTETTFTAKYPTQFSLSHEFHIFSGTITFPDQTQNTFYGNAITSEISSKIQALPVGSTIWLEVQIQEGKEITRTIKSTYRL